MLNVTSKARLLIFYSTACLGWRSERLWVLARWPLFVSPARCEMRGSHAQGCQDWQLNREFHLRRISAALARIDEESPQADVLREHVTDAYVDEADAMRLRHLRHQEDVYNGLHFAARIWWRISLLWSNPLFDREQALYREAKQIREYFEELAAVRAGPSNREVRLSRTQEARDRYDPSKSAAIRRWICSAFALGSSASRMGRPTTM